MLSQTYRITRLALWQAVLLTTALGCAGSSATRTDAPPAATVSFTAISDSIAADPKAEALIAPYRTRLDAQVSEVIGEATAPLPNGDPEAPLGNFATDALLSVVREVTGKPVDIAYISSGGLRIPSLGAGPITIGEMFELMPFENRTAILTLDAASVDSLAQQIARLGGDPVAGLSFRIAGRRAEGVAVGGQPLDPSRKYVVATSDYIANGGDNITALLRPLAREDHPLLIRDALIRYVREQHTIRPVRDGRITRAAN